jgi:hypothetical protein
MQEVRATIPIGESKNIHERAWITGVEIESIFDE